MYHSQSGLMRTAYRDCILCFSGVSLARFHTRPKCCRNTSTNEQTSAIVFEAGDYLVSNWAVSSTHTNLNQNVTSSTALTTSSGTVGYYIEDSLLTDHKLTLPLPGTITHFEGCTYILETLEKSEKTL